MKRRSKLMESLKEEELQRFKKLSPEQRINLEIAHNDFIRSIFGAALKLRGFSQEQIDSLWEGKHE